MMVIEVTMKKYMFLLLILILACCNLFASDVALSLYTGVEESLYINQDESWFFRTSFRTDISVSIQNRYGNMSYGPSIIAEITTPSLAVGNTRYLGHYGFGGGYEAEWDLNDKFSLGGNAALIFGRYLSSDITYASFSLGIHGGYALSDSVHLKTRGAALWKGNMASFALQMGVSYLL